MFGKIAVFLFSEMIYKVCHVCQILEEQMKTYQYYVRSAEIEHHTKKFCIGPMLFFLANVKVALIHWTKNNELL